MSEDTPRRRFWEEDFGEEERLLLAHNFHRVRGLDDVWQKGSGEKLPKSGAEPEMYTRQEALERIEKGLD